MKTLCVFLTFVCCLLPTSLLARDFDYHGATLGMTMEKFRALPPLVDKNPEEIKLAPSIASKIPGGKIKVSEDAEAVGSACAPSDGGGQITCFRFGDSSFPAETFTVMYVFLKDADDVYRLAWISITSNKQHLTEIISGLTEKWGEGTIVEQSSSLLVMNWKKGNSSISLSSPCLDEQYFCIAYMSDKTRQGVMAAYESKIKLGSAAAPSYEQEDSKSQVAALSSRGDNAPIEISQEQIDKIVVGKTTRAEVLELLGPPPTDYPGQPPVEKRVSFTYKMPRRGYGYAAFRASLLSISFTDDVVSYCSAHEDLEKDAEQYYEKKRQECNYYGVGCPRPYRYYRRYRSPVRRR